MRISFVFTLYLVVTYSLGMYFNNRMGGFDGLGAWVAFLLSPVTVPTVLLTALLKSALGLYR